MVAICDHLDLWTGIDKTKRIGEIYRILCALGKTTMSKEITPVEPMILLIRGQKVIIDADLARLYGVTTKRLNEQVKRNKYRFPSDFLFQLTKEEKMELVANCDQFKMLKHTNALPSAFTEHGAIMAATILNSENAIEMSLFVVRAFVKMREILILNKEISKKINELERRVDSNDSQIQTLFQAIQQLIEPQKKPIRRIGFGVDNRSK